MIFQGKNKEYLRLEEIVSKDCTILKEKLPDTLTIVWNVSDTVMHGTVDAQTVYLQKGEMMFLTELHHIDVHCIEKVRMIRFNRPFFCVIDHDSEIGCKGVLFFGASNLPLIHIPFSEIEKFDILWRMFSLEMLSKDNLQVEMLQTMLKRLLILSTRLYKEQQTTIPLQNTHLEVVREFSFLVENYFREKHSVAEYAEMLYKSPKTLSNLFAQQGQKTPLQIIQDRIMIEAKRQLRYTERPVQEIADQLGFDEIQSFSRFFKVKEGISPKAFRDKLISV